MGERLINPILNVHDKYRKVNIINSYWASSDPLINVFSPTTNQLWSNAANWSQGHVPLSTETATISGGNITLDITTTINKLVVAAGRTLSSDVNSRVLNINSDCTILGTLDCSGTLSLKGTNNTIASNVSTKGMISYDGSNQSILPITYFNLQVQNAGTKTVTGNTTVNGTFGVFGASRTTGVFDFASYNFFVQGTSAVHNTKMLRSGAGNLTFVGFFTSNTSTVDSDFSILTSANYVEFRGGFDINHNSLNFGNVVVKCTTNSQSIKMAGSRTLPILTIEGAITVTNAAGSVITLVAVNATNAAGKLKNNGWIFYNNNVIPVVQGGLIDTATAGNTMAYTYNGDVDIPVQTYQGLYFGGTGTKKLTGNTTVGETLTLSAGSKLTSFLDYGSYDITVNGTAAFNSGTLKRMVAGANTGTGNVLHVGAVTMAINGFAIDTPGMLAANYMEFRGGLTTNSVIGFGSGYFKFTTNNQNFSSVSPTIPLPKCVVDNITLTNIAGSSLNVTEMNGTTGTSKLTNLGTLIYYGSSRPMVTGVLEFNSAVNTVYYLLFGNQDVAAGTYRNLRLEGSGAKKLLGNVSVVNTYTLTAPATLDSNGFALTNP